MAHENISVEAHIWLNGAYDQTEWVLLGVLTIPSRRICASITATRYSPDLHLSFTSLQGQADIARRVMGCQLTQEARVEIAVDDVAGNGP